jgi:CheY-like chemotaxis protein
MNYHLIAALNQVSDAVLILQNGIGQLNGPVVVWGNAAAVRWSGLPSEELEGAPFPQLLAVESWNSLRTALQAAFQGQASVCEVWSRLPGSAPVQATARAVPGGTGEILNVILTFQTGAQFPPETGQGSGWRAAGKPSGSVFNGAPAPVPSGPPPTPQAWQGDVIENIRETSRQVAHEFNNALTSILLPVELAIHAIPRSGQIHDSLQVAHASARRAADLARDFLNCFRPRPAVREICASTDLLGRSVRLATCAQNITAEMHLAPDLDALEVDGSQMERVVFNLIRNACQAMPKGGRLRLMADNFQLTAESGVPLPPGKYVRVRLRDWGPGIPERHLPHLFHSRFSTKAGGNGCGLPICYAIVRDHGGEMMVRSKVHLGTVFTIYLPSAGPASQICGSASQPDSCWPGTPVQPPVGASAPGGTNDFGKSQAATIGESQGNGFPAANTEAPGLFARSALDRPMSLLVVDDEHGVRQVLGQIARSRGFDVITAANSDAALQSYTDRLLAGQPFDCVLLDMNLRSGLNGLEVFAEIRRKHHEARVVATSGEHGDGDAARLKQKGFAAFLPKPYTMQCFDRVMHEALDW